MLQLIDERWSTCYIYRPAGTLLLAGAHSQFHGTLVSVRGDGLTDGEILYIKSQNLQREGKLMHLESKSQASKHVIKIDSYSTVFGNVVALHTRNVKNGTVMHITSSNGSNFVGSGKLLHVAGDSESNGCLLHLSCNYIVDGTAIKIHGKGRKSLACIASTSRYLPMGVFNLKADSAKTGQIFRVSADSLRAGTLLHLESKSTNFMTKGIKNEIDQKEICKYGLLNWIKFTEINYPNIVEPTINYIMEYGYLDCLEYCYKKNYKWNEISSSIAAKYGNLKCLKFAYDHGCNVDLVSSWEAAENGHLNCLKFIHINYLGWDENTDS